MYFDIWIGIIPLRIIGIRSKMSSSSCDNARTSTPTENGITLRGWFLKEKRDKFKRRTKTSFVSTSNRRWFQIERIGNENAICYYKRCPKKDEQPTGFFFLNDITSLCQDIPKKVITIEHPSRILRLESPSRAQHSHSYSALVRSCPNAQTTQTDSSLADIGNSPPSNSFYSGSSSSSLTTARQNSSGGTATAKDEIKFLKEITGNNNLIISHSSSDSGIRDTSDSSSESEKENFAPLLTLEREQEEEKTAVEPLYYNGNGREDDGAGEAFKLEKVKAAIPNLTKDIPKGDSFASHQIQRSSSYRQHFGDDDIQPDEDFLADDWDD